MTKQQVEDIVTLMHHVHAIRTIVDVVNTSNPRGRRVSEKEVRAVILKHLKGNARWNGINLFRMRHGWGDARLERDLQRCYETYRFSLSDMAARYGACQDTVRGYLLAYGVDIRRPVGVTGRHQALKRAHTAREFGGQGREKLRPTLVASLQD